MNIEDYNLNTFRKLVRSLQKENRKLKEQLKKANIPYELDFIAKNTLDKFALVDNIRASVRDMISKESVSNILVRRDFLSAFPAKVIIEKDWIRTENWCRVRRQGNILETEFTPYPKNPILARFFVAVGLADTIGTGVRNLYKYTPIYTVGGKTELIEGDVFSD